MPVPILLIAGAAAIAAGLLSEKRKGDPKPEPKPEPKPGRQELTPPENEVKASKSKAKAGPSEPDQDDPKPPKSSEQTEDV